MIRAEIVRPGRDRRLSGTRRFMRRGRLPCCCEYLPSSGPPTASQAGSDPAAGCSEEGSEHRGPTDTYRGLVVMHQCINSTSAVKEAMQPSAPA